MYIKSNLIISAPYIVVPEEYWRPLLGELLKQSGLISEAQLQIALMDKNQLPGQRLGEILTWRGWLKQGTADFFAEQWMNCLENNQKEPIGTYLKEAALLSDTQIQAILAEQNKLNIKFGAAAVLKGYLKQTTINFFIEHLFPEYQHSSCQRELQKKSLNLSSEQKLTQPEIVKPKIVEEKGEDLEAKLTEINWINTRF